MDKIYIKVNLIIIIKSVNTPNSFMMFNKEQDFMQPSTFISTNTKTERNSDCCLQYIPWLNQYKRNEKRQILLKQKEKVIDKMNLQNQVNKTVKQKEIKDYYLKYDINPFIELKEEQKLIISQRKKSEVSNIVNILTPSRKERKQIRLNITDKKQSMGARNRELYLRSEKVINSIQKKSKFKQQLIQMFKQKQNKQNMQNIKSNQPKVISVKEPELYEMNIEDIADYKQNNSFISSQYKINIFKFARDQEDYITGLDRLRHLNFSFKAVIQKNFKFRVPIYREISTFSRGLIINNHTGTDKILDFLYSDELTLNMKELTMSDVLNVASNRISPQLVQKIWFSMDTYETKEGSDTSSEELERQNPIYKKNWIDKESKYICENQQEQEIQVCRILPLDEIQQNHYIEREDKKQKLLDKMKYQNFLFENQIKDKKITIKLTDEIKQSIRKYIVPKKQKKQIDFAQIVRQKKKKSNKQNSISYKLFSQFLKQKNALAGAQAELRREKINKQKLIFQ